MKHYLRNLYLVKSDPDLLHYCMQNLDQYCKTLTEYSSCNTQSHHINSPSTQHRVLWISDALDKNVKLNSNINLKHITFIHAKHYRQILGQEFSLIIYDIASGVRANPWYAVIGTLQLGGIMLLLSPTTDIASLPSALPMSYTQANCSDVPVSTTATSYDTHFNALFADLFTKHFPNQMLLNTEQLVDCLASWQQIQTQRLNESLPESVTKQLQLAINEQASVGKQLVDNLLSQLLDDKKPNIHLLQADRGRGKSDLLGQLPALLLQASKRNSQTDPLDVRVAGAVGVTGCRFTQIIYITQSNEASRTIRNGLYRFRDHLIGLENRTDNIGPIHVRFCAPDDPSLFTQANKQNANQTLLLVDEAASLPVYWLQQAVAHYSSIVFATTTHGYENNGLGFSLTFLPTLDSYTTQQLTHPIRFIGQCPLESFAATLLTPHNSSHTPIYFADGLHILKHKHLMAQPELRSAVMACLMEAHYQTAPDDLQRLLDAPDMQCGVYIQDKQLIGCIWIVQEGEINDEELQQRISQGIRRVNGHLSVQQLAYTYGITSILNKQVWRINRIAVLPKYQNAGFGTQILAALLQQANLTNVHMITSAFGASKQLIRFWRNNDYEVVKLGQQINSVTGLVNAIVILPMATHIPQELISHIQGWHSIAQDWHTLLSRDIQKIEIEHTFAHTKITKQTKSQLSAHAKKMINEFLDGNRSFDYVEIYIYWYVQNIAKTHSSIVIDRYIEGYPLKTLLTNYHLVNKKALIAEIKTALHKTILV